MRVTSKGQVTIPQEIRERHGLMPGADIAFVEMDGRVVIELNITHDDRGTRVVDRLRGRGDTGMTTDEILALTRR